MNIIQFFKILIRILILLNESLNEISLSKIIINKSLNENISNHKNSFIQNEKNEKIEIINSFELKKKFQFNESILSSSLIDIESKYKDNLN